MIRHREMVKVFKEMHRYLDRREQGEYKLEKFEIGGPIREYIPNGTYVRLRGSRGVIMSDTPMEQDTNREFVRRAHGDVLIGGLGIGMILLAIQDKPEVTSVTVVEYSKEIIEMVEDQLPLNNKVKIINDDIFNWKPNRGSKYDIIYFDIWNYINSDIYEEMKELKKKYRGRLKSKKESPDSKMWCWAEYEAKNNIRL